MNKPEYHVRIGQMIVGTEGEILKTVLGSCVGIALIWKKRNKSILAHCLLPYPVSQQEDNEARYVSLTLPRMLERLGASPGDYGDLEAVIAGGGQMMEVDQPYTKFVVGEENLKIAKQCIEKLRIKIVTFQCGGDQGTKITLDSSSGQHEVEKVPKVA